MKKRQKAHFAPLRFYLLFSVPPFPIYTAGVCFCRHVKFSIFFFGEARESQLVSVSTRQAHKLKKIRHFCHSRKNDRLLEIGKKNLLFNLFRKPPCLEHVRVKEKRKDRESSNPAAYRREKQINRNRRKREKNMVLTPRQRDELKTAVASFLKEIGADEARKVFIQESDVKNVSLKIYLFFHT